MPEHLRDGLFARMAIEHHDEAGVVVFTSQAWRRLFDTRRPLVWELILEFLSTLGFKEVLLDLDAPDTIQDLVLRLCHRMMAHSIVGRSQAPEKVTVTDLFYLRGLYVGSWALAEHFGLLTDEILGGLTVITPELQIIDMAELVRLQIYVQLDDTWAWVAMGPERNLSSHLRHHQLLPGPCLRGWPDLRRTFSTWVVTGLGRVMDRAGVTYTPYSHTHVPYQRCVRRRIDEASTSAAQQDQQQPDP
ncbi:hypothetical protein Tco_1495631 [Tanacetum coccineum]